MLCAAGSDFGNHTSLPTPLEITAPVLSPTAVDTAAATLFSQLSSTAAPLGLVSQQGTRGSVVKAVSASLPACTPSESVPPPDTGHSDLVASAAQRAAGF